MSFYECEKCGGAVGLFCTCKTAQPTSTNKAWHAPGMGEVHSADHKYMIDCLAEIDAPSQDYVACNELAEKVAAALNAASAQEVSAGLTDEQMDDAWDRYACEDGSVSYCERYRFMRALLCAHQAQPNVGEMVNKFLGWKLPKDFCPDAGISFKPTKPYEGDEYGNSWWPIGTNLFSADQAKAMFEHCLAEQGHTP